MIALLRQRSYLNGSNLTYSQLELVLALRKTFGNLLAYASSRHMVYQKRDDVLMSVTNLKCSEPKRLNLWYTWSNAQRGRLPRHSRRPQVSFSARHRSMRDYFQSSENILWNHSTAMILVARNLRLNNGEDLAEEAIEATTTWGPVNFIPSIRFYSLVAH
jgi:hypothetical protein